MKCLRIAGIVILTIVAGTCSVFADIVWPGDGGGNDNIILPICLIGAAIIVISLVIKVLRKK